MLSMAEMKVLSDDAAVCARLMCNFAPTDTDGRPTDVIIAQMPAAKQMNNVAAALALLCGRGGAHSGRRRPGRRAFALQGGQAHVFGKVKVTGLG